MKNFTNATKKEYKRTDEPPLACFHRVIPLPLSGRVNVEWIKMSDMLLEANFMLVLKIIEIFSAFFMSFPRL